MAVCLLLNDDLYHTVVDLHAYWHLDWQRTQITMYNDQTCASV